VKKYPAYTHDQAAELSVSEIMHFTLENKYEDLIASKMAALQKQDDKKK